MRLNFIFQKIRNLGRPTRYWGPALPKHRAKVTHLSAFEVDPHGLSSGFVENGKVRTGHTPSQTSADLGSMQGWGQSAVDPGTRA